MELNIASLEIEPKRQTFGHIAERFGEDRPASRYEEAVYDAQPTENFHYRPQWEPEFEIYDKNRTAIKMEDWYKLLDPRKFHYMSYVSTRASQNSTYEQNFEFIERRELTKFIKEENLKKVFDYLTPLRHYEYGANMNNLTIVDRAYGTAIVSASLFQAEDRLGLAQHITKIILLLADNDVSKLEEGKDAWLNCPKWQGLRKAIEDSFVQKDPMRLFIKQNLVFDSYVIPLLINEFSQEMAENQETTVAMLTEFITFWFEETSKWIDSVVVTMAKESEENKNLVVSWISEDIKIIENALQELTKFSDKKETLISKVGTNFVNRLNQNGINI